MQLTLGSICCRPFPALVSLLCLAGLFNFTKFVANAMSIRCGRAERAQRGGGARDGVALTAIICGRRGCLCLKLIYDF